MCFTSSVIAKRPLQGDYDNSLLPRVRCDGFEAARPPQPHIGVWLRPYLRLYIQKYLAVVETMSGPTIVFAPVDSRDRYRAALPPFLQGLY